MLRSTGLLIREVGVTPDNNQREYINDKSHPVVGGFSLFLGSFVISWTWWKMKFAHSDRFGVGSYVGLILLGWGFLWLGLWFFGL